MSLVLMEGQVCPYSTKCPYTNTANSICRGCDPKRENIFSCNFVNEQGDFSKNKYRSKFDETGKMRILQE